MLYSTLKCCSLTVSCVSLNDPENGNVTCPSNTSVFQDTCTYYCNRGYQLEGNRQTRCSADGTWSSEPVTCTILTCNDPEVEITNSQSVGDCSSVTYGSSCLLNCSSGYNVSGNGEHVCDDVNDEGTSVKWRSVGGEFVCVAACKYYSCIVLSCLLQLLYYVANGDSSVAGAAIGGAVGGVIVLVLIVLCITVLVVRQSYKKNGYPTDKRNDNVDLTFPHYKSIKMAIFKKSTNSAKVTTQPNPSFRLSSNAKSNGKISNDQYANIKPSKFIKDPVYEVHGDVIVKVKDALSYGLQKNTIKVEDDPSYSYGLHHTEDMVQTENDPVYQPCNVNSNTVRVEDDPAYYGPHHMNNNAVRVEDDPAYGPHYMSSNTVRAEDDPAYGQHYMNSNTVRVEDDPAYGPHHMNSNTVRVEDDPAYGPHYMSSNTVRVEDDPAYGPHYMSSNTVRVEDDPAYYGPQHINSNTVRVEVDPAYGLHTTENDPAYGPYHVNNIVKIENELSYYTGNTVQAENDPSYHINNNH